MLHQLFTGLLAFIFTGACGQFFSIDTLKATGPKEFSGMISSVNKYIFPKFNSNVRAAAAKKINDHLTEDLLETKLGEEKQSIFENVWGSEEFQIPRLTDISWQIISNTGKILSVNMSGQGCGAYCEGFTRGYNYNSMTGNTLHLDSILNPSGTKRLCDSLDKSKREIITNFIDKVKLNIKNGKGDPGRDPEMLEMYQSCLEWNFSIYPEYVNSMDFTIENEQLSVVLGRCSAHVNQALDELGEFTFKIQLRDWKQYLTPLGASLLKK
ncbi:MAG: hypothetical protein EPN85_08635 [Bacteroidetes bacterium]|nr:MAG: hypothetical protein EPN85_08635 [Bacteroidota bacterium]